MCVVPRSQGYNEFCVFSIALSVARLLEGNTAFLATVSAATFEFTEA